MTERVRFENEKSLEMYLSVLMSKLDKDDEYNIFLHQINECGYKGFKISDVIECKIKSIINNKLKIKMAEEVDKLFEKYQTSTPATAIVRAYKDEDELRYHESLFDL